MTYIDKDKALNLDFRINVSLFESRRKTAERAVQAYADAINAIPAADVRPVVRGRWIEHYEPYSTGEEMIEEQFGYECSNCGRWEYEKEPFCNCGAMMEES